MTKVFLLGATGHIGGAIVDAIQARFPDVQITALVRDHDKAQRLEKRFQRIRVVVGNFTNVDLIESESKAAGIVIYTSPDGANGSHGAIKAILRGLASRPGKGFYIQTSGAYLIGEETSGKRGSEKVWSDIVDIEQLTTMPSDRIHQPTDQLARDGSTDVNVAIVSPTVVYGLSTSTGNQIPITIRDIVATAKEISAGFTMSQGMNILGYVHVNDLVEIYLTLLADAMKGPEKANNRLWGRHAYYFANVEELTFAEYMEALVKILKAKGVIPTDVIREIGEESDASELKVAYKTARSHACGANIRCRSERAETLLSWKPKQRSVKETLPEVVDLLLSHEKQL